MKTFCFIKTHVVALLQENTLCVSQLHLSTFSVSSQKQTCIRSIVPQLMLTVNQCCLVLTHNILFESFRFMFFSPVFILLFTGAPVFVTDVLFTGVFFLPSDLLFCTVLPNEDGMDVAHETFAHNDFHYFMILSKLA